MCENGEGSSGSNFYSNKEEPEIREHQAKMDHLPTELIHHVLSELEFSDRLAISKCCSRLYEITHPTCRRIRGITIKGSPQAEYYFMDVVCDKGFKKRYEVSMGGSLVHLTTTTCRKMDEVKTIKKMCGVGRPNSIICRLFEDILRSCDYIEEIHLGCMGDFENILKRNDCLVRDISLPYTENISQVVNQIRPRKLVLFSESQTTNSSLLPKGKIRFADLRSLHTVHLYMDTELDFDDLMESSVKNFFCKCNKPPFSEKETRLLYEAWMRGERDWHRLQVLSSSAFSRKCFPETEDVGYPQAFPRPSKCVRLTVDTAANVSGSQAFVALEGGEICFEARYRCRECSPQHS
ncbi:unnamed protein product [Caenorhabditis auriculariae]|uniref:F-box domain-containing protein n=1 Tax=Caenorhabditis auriculariae TaxID=2777116 RepID=A0A8S1GMY4_9PELO|nr:unnamed protein product [Caenorhabditis auriculariae]